MSPPISDRRRVREVRKFYIRSPDDVPVTGSTIDATTSTAEIAAASSPNTSLTALVQLIAWRLGAQRALISVVDEKSQYFLAEATKTLNLSDSSQHAAGDGLWKGCGGTIRSEALCANTIETQPGNNKYACFSVEDLSKDERFCRLPYVAGAPNFRYYAGTPLLTTKLGIPIGSVFVIDDRPRGHPTKAEIEFLGDMARNVMEYLELRRENMMRERAEILYNGLAAFVDGKSGIEPPLPEDRDDLQHTGSSPSNGNSELSQSECNEAEISSVMTPVTGVSDNTHLLNIKNSPAKSEESSCDPSFLKRSPEFGMEDDELGEERLFQRASNILREAFDVSYTAFFDVRASNTAFVDEMSTDFTDISDEFVSSGNQLPTRRKSSVATIPTTLLRESLVLTSAQQQWDEDKTTTATSTGRQTSRLSTANLLSFSLDSSLLTQPHISTENPLPFNAPEQRHLRSIIKRYPAGKLWTFNDQGAESSDEEDLISSGFLSPTSHTSYSRVHLRESDFLVSCFPGVKQVLFAPVLEAGAGKVNHKAACFAVSLKPEPVFVSDKETAYIRVFMNSITVACSLANTKTANKQKGDFISSISHELRSPLHGVMASVELLGGSNLDKQQRELCDTIATCGEVLHETISDILEYTKINSLRKDARGRMKSSRIMSQESLSGDGNNEDTTFSRMMAEEPASPISDIAVLCENAVGVVAAAHMLSKLNSEVHLHRIYALPGATTIIHDEEVKLKQGSVNVILDISHADWEFVCIPGAFQRIVMNLVGNSLKYTKSGFIQVQMSIKAVGDVGSNEKSRSPAKKEVVVNVLDSGKGISTEFLKKKAFSAFSQESVLAPGTGLGLHTVRSLVQMHGGTVQIKSQVGKGTSVTVALPLLRAPHSSTIPRSSAETIDVNSSAKRSLYALDMRESFQRGTFAIDLRSGTSHMIRESLQRYLTEWFDMSPVPIKVTSEAPEIAFLDEAGFMDHFAQPRGISETSFLSQARLIVVCEPTRQPLLFQHISKCGVIAEILTTPFGPYKLSRTMLSSLKTPIPTPTQSYPTTKNIDTDAKLANVSAALSPSLDQPVAEVHPSPDNLPVRESPTSLPLALRPSESLKSNPLRILCVDDNPINLRILKSFLEKLNFTDIVYAINGSDAFDAVRQRIDGFELIFMDLSMPVLDGFSAISMIRGLEKLMQKYPSSHARTNETTVNSIGVKKAFIVALTGLAAQKDQDAARDAGADYFITKPLKMARLKQLLVEWSFMR